MAPPGEPKESGATDLAIGVITGGSAAAVDSVVKIVRAGMAAHFGGLTADVIHVDGTLTDDRAGQVEEIGEGLRLVHARPSSPLPPGDDGSGWSEGLRTVLGLARERGARGLVMLNGEIISMTPEWIRCLGETVLSECRDFVLPVYQRRRYERPLTHHILLLLLRRRRDHRSRAHARWMPAGRARPSADRGANPRPRRPGRHGRPERISLQRVPDGRSPVGESGLRFPPRLPGARHVAEPYLPVPGPAVPRPGRLPRAGDAPAAGRRGRPIDGASRPRLRGREALPGGSLAMKKDRRPIVITHVGPALEDGRYPVKREVGDRLVVTADIFKEGHAVLAAAIVFRAQDESAWRESPMRLVDNDGWAGDAPLESK